MISSKKEAADISFEVDAEKTLNASVFSGELQTILVNLFDNAVFWINYSQKKSKTISVKARQINDAKARITVSDSGTGIAREDASKIFQPGITSKPHGIGMGLVIVTELLNNYDCRIATIIPGELNGATFEFDVPLERIAEK